MDGCLRQTFTPEFLGRLDRVVHFDSLKDSAMEQIALKYLTRLEQRTAAQGIRLQLPVELASHLGRIGKGKGGARQMRRVVQEQVEGPLAAFLLGCNRKPCLIQARLDGELVCFQD
jgi:ATP-dependent Clp protease ATP-binding subunit ClpA